MTRQSTILFVLVAGLALASCGGVEPWEEPVDQLVLTGKADGATLRTVTLTLAAGSTKRYRVTATGFSATLSQTTSMQAQLSAKHYTYNIQGQAGLAPTVQATADGTVRNWTLRVVNLGTIALSGTVTVKALDTTTADPELGLISDIDKTVLPPHTSGSTLPAPYPGVAALLQRLELGADGAGQTGDLTYVTARTPDRLTGLTAWMSQNGLPAGPIETGTSGVPWIAQAEKVKDISKVFDANPGQSFVLFGDSSHRDPEVYREVITKYGARVKAALIHKVNNPSPDRLTGLHLITSYAEAAAVLYGEKLLDKASARKVMKQAQTDGLAITDAEIDALLAAHDPPPVTGSFSGNTASKSFHAPGCRYHGCASCTVTFTTREAALAAGYHPCGLCKP